MNLEASTIARVTTRLVPFLIVCYFVAYLDRVNVGFAALTMNKDLGLTSQAFGIGAGIFLIGQPVARRLGQVAFAGLPTLLARLGAPVLVRPLGQVVVRVLAALVAAALGLVALHAHLRLAGGPLPSAAALVALGDVGLDAVP